MLDAFAQPYLLEGSAHSDQKRIQTLNRYVTDLLLRVCILLGHIRLSLINFRSHCFLFDFGWLSVKKLLVGVSLRTCRRFWAKNYTKQTIGWSFTWPEGDSDPSPKLWSPLMVEGLKWILFVLRRICERFIFQLEDIGEGEFHNFHYQGCFKLKKTRWITLHWLFNHCGLRCAWVISGMIWLTPNWNNDIYDALNWYLINIWIVK